jgi:prolyl-tRNA editing enzyme YbaK/EbsC (Cys-tRNA(Pro) deacylase)
MGTTLEDRVVGHLESLGADFRAFPIDPSFADTAVFCERYGYTLDQSANAILVASKRPPGEFCMCLALATTRLDVNRRVKGLMGVGRLSFATAEQTIEVTGMEIGGVTPFGLDDPPQIYVDSAIVDLGRAVVGGGSRAMKVEIDPEVFTRMEGVAVIEGLATPYPAP